MRSKRRPRSEAEPIDVDDVRDDFRLNAKAAEHVLEKPRRDGVSLDPSQDAPGNGRSAKVIRSLAAAIVHHDLFAQELGDENGGERREQERDVRRGKDVNDVSAPQFAEKQRPVGQLRCDRADVLDFDGPSQNPRWNRVDGNEPGVDSP